MMTVFTGIFLNTKGSKLRKATLIKPRNDIQQEIKIKSLTFCYYFEVMVIQNTSKVHLASIT